MRILIAEDETIIRLDLRELLERSGFEVCAEARDGEEAVQLAHSTEPDLALLDVKMPRLDGIEAARRILEERPIPIVMVTAYGEEELVSRAVEVGRVRLPREAVSRERLVPAIATARARHEELRRRSRRGRVPHRGARRTKGDRARQGPADGAGGAHRAGRVRPAAQGEPDLRASRCASWPRRWSRRSAPIRRRRRAESDDSLSARLGVSSRRAAARPRAARASGDPTRRPRPTSTNGRTRTMAK